MAKPAGERGNLRIAVNELCKPYDIDVRPPRHGLAGKPGFIYFASLARASSTSISHRTPSGRVLTGCAEKKEIHLLSGDQ